MGVAVGATECDGSVGKLTPAVAVDVVVEAVACTSEANKFPAKGTRPCIGSDCSTVASSPRPGSPSSSMTSLEMPSMAAFRPPPGLEIRNTFLHVGASRTEERAVQSMPHGMFSQCLADESALRPKFQRVNKVEAGTCDKGAYVHNTSAPLVEGTEVIIDGLLKCPSFNGLRVTVDYFDVSTGRYNVLFANPVAGHKTAKVKRENLLLVSPPTSHFGLPLALNGCPIGEEGLMETWQTTTLWA